MKILNKLQIQEADRQTIAKEPISSINLMERAAMACMNWIVERYDHNQSFVFLCGTGSNGGDGLALFRLLIEKGYPCTLYEFQLGKNQQTDYTQNRNRINKNLIHPLTVESLNQISPKDIFIDALVGTGLNRAITGKLKHIIQTLNQLPNGVLSIDIPSGLFSEFNTNNSCEGIVQADHTLSFQMPKLAFLLPEKGGKVGSFYILDIELLPDFINNVKTPYFYLTPKKAKSLYQALKKFDHKGSNGHLLLIAGSKGKIGAAQLSAKAALRSGVGKLSVLTPQCGVEILHNTLPEAMIEYNTGIKCISGYYGLKYNTISIGPGLGTSNKTKDFLNSFFNESTSQMVIDADALNLIAAHPEWMNILPKNSILTPHPKEFERLVGTWKNEEEKLQRLIHFTQEHQIICVLKGAHTAIAFPDGNIWFNSSGNPGMATAGSGDVLTGIIGALLAKGYTPEQAALLGVYVHGRAADIQVKSLAPKFLIASDIINGLNDVWKEMEKTA